MKSAVLTDADGNTVDILRRDRIFSVGARYVELMGYHCLAYPEEDKEVYLDKDLKHDRLTNELVGTESLTDEEYRFDPKTVPHRFCDTVLPGYDPNSQDTDPFTEDDEGNPIPRP